MTKAANIKMGTILVITEGCYSSYGITAYYRAAKKFNPDDVVNTYIQEFGDDAGYKDDAKFYTPVDQLKWRGRVEDCLRYLSDKGYIELLDGDDAPRELHMGEYGRLSL